MAKAWPLGLFLVDEKTLTKLKILLGLCKNILSTDIGCKASERHGFCFCSGFSGWPGRCFGFFGRAFVGVDIGVPRISMSALEGAWLLGSGQWPG